MSTLIRNGAIPKSDGWVQSVLEWLTLHGLFALRKKSEKSPFVAVGHVPLSYFSYNSLTIPV